ncbi:unnamed protein product [Didymodactylos carnosus]|uniref:LRRNT domain-containing protein n=1 Tax=Didymodactylos carnosus TaxID=1234261 RepID=A0A813SCZ9_9BILA|nr:unnamed protein product [Didymodactylos carnosus]CAF0858219.1 unnamed protein product [Didymodactylos carnosus]CAF3577783.1 unnamed protein product [Didymodactylos carnosus]CAF3643194.1 unnamed protein product [Didymodactylos carnosus]
MNSPFDFVNHRHRLILLLTCIYILLNILPQSIEACPNECTCHGPNVDCSNRGLQQIPLGIPRNVFKL